MVSISFPDVLNRKGQMVVFIVTRRLTCITGKIGGWYLPSIIRIRTAIFQPVVFWNVLKYCSINRLKSMSCILNCIQLVQVMIQVMWELLLVISRWDRFCIVINF